VPDSFVLAVEVHGVTLIQTLENPGERDLGGFDEKVHMVGHQHVRKEKEAITLLVLGEKVQISDKVEFRSENLLPLVSPGEDMI